MKRVVRTEGKKQQGRVLEETKYALIYNCPDCNATLVKLETGVGEPYTAKDNEVYYDLYWICLCPKGHGKFRVKDTTFKMYLDGK